MPTNNKESYQNLADHYLKQGNQKKYKHYIELARSIKDDSFAPEPISTTENLLVPSVEELIKLYNFGKHSMLVELAAKNPNHEILPYLASSIYFSQNKPDLAAESASNIKDNDQKRLRIKTAGAWKKINKPLNSEPRVHLLILSHNREEYVENALQQLAATDYRNYAVYIADNGSEDRTWDIVQEAVKAFPEHIKVKIEKFPTNIGRPAGHNWLLTKYDHSGADYIAIGDDDLVEVPPDWLTRMVQTAKAFPRCAVVGGKALNPGKPDVIHGGIRNITRFSSDQLNLSNGDDQIDYGQFDYVDKVDHVIGCLHIYDRQILFDEVGLFDIRFSPCQYVDIDHHLRIRMLGYDIIFNGLISFRHLRAMGNQAKKDITLAGNSQGNAIKILHKFNQHAVNKQLNFLSEERMKWLNAD
ncbi:glycosyltransferase family 2 protein [Desulfonatronovibrio magnus]|uniref:glycosyltransferase family 2 protein n=1 Tax=Desulfonatronovibrio magnus TaxID=698827 RepID=UPI0005EBD03A|nr:glycosyltransferase family 2 protein [Desulfonatronovibrio magnus]